MYILVRPRGFVILIIVVDDMALASDSRGLLEHIKKLHISTFKVKLLGPLTSFIGWNILRTDKGIHISQRKYLEGILQEHNLAHVKPVPTPLPLNADLAALHEEYFPLPPTEHSSIVRS